MGNGGQTTPAGLCSLVRASEFENMPVEGDLGIFLTICCRFLCRTLCLAGLDYGGRDWPVGNAGQAESGILNFAGVART